MSKRDEKKSSTAGSYVWRDDKTGKLSKIDLRQPQGRPTSTTVTEIKRAIRETNAAQKPK